MSELDLGLKVGARKLLWNMGYSTRLDVELRAEAAGPVERQGQAQPINEGSKSNPGKGGPETFTDLDVLGVLVTSGFQFTTTIADCKTGHRDKPVARMFWTRGVADLFGADQAMLVREHDVNDATKQLSSRLNITVLPTADLNAMQEVNADPNLDLAGPLSVLFDRGAVSKYLAAFTGLNRRLNPLLEYRDFDYWVYEHHRNPIQLIAHLQEASSHLEHNHPIHQALFVDLAWLFTLSLTRACAYIQGAFLRDPDRGLQEYLFGGATNLREKQETADLLKQFAPAGTEPLSLLPAYYPPLRELVTRLLRRPNEIQRALQYAETISALMVGNRERVPIPDVFAGTYSPVAAKLLADVCGFLVSASGLNNAFRTQARAWLLDEPVKPSQGQQQTTADPGSTRRPGGREKPGTDDGPSGGPAKTQSLLLPGFEQLDT